MASKALEPVVVEKYTDRDYVASCTADQVPEIFKRLEEILKPASSRVYTLGSGGVPRMPVRELEDQLRGQGVPRPDVRAMYPDSWIGKCTECRKYINAICWANKKMPYNPAGPGKDGVCTLRYPGGQFKARRLRR